MNSRNYKMLSVHTTNARLIKFSDHRLGNSKQKSEMPALKKRCIMCAIERDMYIYTTSKQKLGKKISSRPSGMGDYRIKDRIGNNESKLLVYFDFIDKFCIEIAVSMTTFTYDSVLLSRYVDCIE
jgi:hypothetical protein